ncbi:MAG: isoprenylcysteine carboxylmethyltransferase family protein [Thermoanaerobaculia bacterium]|nr:isoprenylcysteine carboxylmethyltransferase family protein [Thermoanaerobaculia bacterium]
MSESTGTPKRSSLFRTAWLFYAIIVFEILFMISPAGLHFYAVYGPALDVLHGTAETAWLTTFYLPHFSFTSNPVLQAAKPIGFALLYTGLLAFAIGFVQIYWAKLRRRGHVVGGLYRWIRHPQYLALAVVGLGTSLVWPRFLVVLSYVTMLCLYSWLARREEAACVERFGDSYRSYMASTGRFLPRALGRTRSGKLSTAGALLRWALALGATTLLAFVVRDFSLLHVSAHYERRAAVLSPALLPGDELEAAYRLARQDMAVEKVLAQRPDRALLVYVLPESWFLADLPAETYQPGQSGHETPVGFPRGLYKVLFTHPRTYAADAEGADIVRKAYGRDTLILAHVNLETGEVLGVERPPTHVVWGDIPTPLF